MPNDPQQVQTIFGQAVQKAESERAEFLERACGGDSELRRRVEALIAAHESSGCFLDSPPKDLAGTSPTIAQSLPEQAGSLIGPFKLLQQIGEGGMGMVYMAEQIEPVERRVALKIIKPGMDTKSVIGRFEAERQALAMMDHPNIAKVLDVGTTNSGRPYFVMELVRGVPITQYCDEHQLTPRQRLELFLPVCQAVQHAHQKGIIHRDIKPSNVLVAEYDDRPVPKIIDFGLAKAMEKRLTAKTMFTEFGQIVGTPDYMSPEQAKLNQMDIDTRSDIYSLGVLLYELLSGNTPFDRLRMRSAAFDELLRIIREEEPPKPSQRLSTVDTLPSIATNRHITPAELTRQLSGELDWIVMKSMEKDRARRYETANGLAADIRHFLDDEPVVACPPSSAYRFKKFARRNKVAFGVALLIAATLMVGIVGTSWQAIRATNAADRANGAEHLAQRRLTQEQQARREADQARKEEARQRRLAVASQEHASNNLKLALAALDDIYLNAIGEERLLSELLRNNEGELRVNRVGRAFSEEERELLRRGLEFYQQFAAANQDSADAALHVARANYRVASLRAGLGQFESARVAFTKAVSTFQDIIAQGDADAALYSELAKSQQGLAATLDWDGSRESLEAADRSCSEAIRLNPLDANLYTQRGDVRWELGRKNAIADFERAMKLEPENVSHQLALAAWYAHGISSVRDYEKAMLHAERAVQLAPDDARTHSAIGKSLINRDRSSGLQSILEHLDRALELDANDYWSLEYRATALSELGGDHESALVDANKAVQLLPNYYRGYFRRAMVYRGLKEYEKGLADCDRAEKLAPLSPQPIRARGMILRAQEKLPEAIAEFSRAIELLPNWATLYQERADTHKLARDHQSAIEDYTVAISLLPDEIPRNSVGIINRRAESYLALGKFEDAAVDYTKAVELAPDHVWPRFNRGNCQFQLGRYDQALYDFERAIELAPSKTYYRKRAALAHFKLGQLEEAIRDLKVRVNDDPNDVSTIVWIDPRHVAACADVPFQDALRALANQLVDSTSRVPEALIHRAELLFALGDVSSAEADLARSAELAPDDPVIHRKRATCLAKQSRWSEASEALSKAIELGDANLRLQYELALCSLAAANRPRYRELCRNLLDTESKTMNSQELNLDAWTCIVAANATDNYESVLALASEAVEQSPHELPFLNTLGAALYRLGRYQAAIEKLTEVDRQLAEKEFQSNFSPACTWYFLAMTHRALDNSTEATNWLTQANEWTDKVLTDDENPPPWNRKLTLELLRDEATKLISQ